MGFLFFFLYILHVFFLELLCLLVDISLMFPQFFFKDFIGLSYFYEKNLSAVASNIKA